MVNQKVLNYLKKGRNRGFSLRSLETKLLESGFPEKEIEEASRQIQTKRKDPSKKSKKRPKKQPKKQKQDNEEKDLPTGAKVCSTLYYIQATIFFLYPFTTLIGGPLAFGVAGALLGGAITALFFIALISFSILSFFIGKGIGNSRKWARITAIVFSSIGLILGTIQYFDSGELLGGKIVFLFLICLDAYAAGYLLFSKKAKEALSK